ncbi:MAG: hypothetical protein ACR2ND_13620 [Solirubrobacteraceae bacterium]
MRDSPVECHSAHHFETSDLAFDRHSRVFRTMPHESLLVQDVVYVCRHLGM